MKTLYSIIFTFLASGVFGQLTFEFDINDANPNDNTSEIEVYVKNASGSTQTMVGFTSVFYFNSAEASISSTDFTPVNTLGWDTAGAGSSSTQNPVSNVPGVSIMHDTKLEIQAQDLNFFGVPAAFNEFGDNTRTLLAIITVDHSPGTANDGGEAFMGGNPNTSISYTDANFSDVPVLITSSNAQILPIVVANFDVEKTGQRSANVLWQTSSETNSSHFIVQRSNDTKSWESIGEVAAAGNSTTTIDYSFLDETIPTTLRSGNNVFYYRLVSVDLDESYSISEIRSLSFKPSSTTVSVYPNPTAQHIVVDLTSIEGESTVQILNMEGRLVRQQQVTDEHNGLPVYNLREMGLKRGQYIVRVIESQSGQVHNKKVIYID